MARAITFTEEVSYQPLIMGGKIIWTPEVNAEYRMQGARPFASRAIVDTGSVWCAIPDGIAVEAFDISLAECERQVVVGIEGETAVPFTRILVRTLGVEMECKVLLLSQNLFLIGRVPLFSMVEVGFHEEPNGARNRILYATR